MEIYVNFKDHRHCEMFDLLIKDKAPDSTHYIDKYIDEILFDLETGNILAESVFNDFRVLSQFLDKYTRENINTFTFISELHK